MNRLPLLLLLSLAYFSTRQVFNSAIIQLPDPFSSKMGPNSLDVLIIGAGPAGLSAALTLARQLHTAVVFDSNVYRNELSNHMHTVATWDHKDPREFRSATRTEILKRYGTISFVDTPIERVEKGANEVFTATARDGRSWQGSRILLATGVRDLAPDIKGYGNCWGRGM